MGIADELEIGLIRPGELWAGHLLWPTAHAEELIAAWAAILPELPETVTSTIALLRLPPAGPFPDELLGTPVVHLSFASTGGRIALTALRDGLQAVARPIVDSTGPADAERLAQIHLDPPGRVAAAGGGLWLTADAAGQAAKLLLAARVGEQDGVTMAELRHVASHAPALPGALTAAPGLFLLHLVGDGDDEHRAATRAAIRQVFARAAGLTVDVDAVSFREGDSRVGGTGGATAARLRTIARELDPDGAFRFERIAPATAG